MDGRLYCKKIVKESGSNFYYSFFFLGRDKRRAMYAFYAFSRIIDDIVDGNWEEEIAQKQLDFWRKEAASCFNGESRHPLTTELRWAVTRFKIPREYLDDLLDGVTMDLKNKRYQTFETLKDYCYHVAAVVGLVCLKIFEVEEDAPTKEAAINLGLALQLTNIIRDVGSDSKRDRIYLPKDEMDHFGVKEGDILKLNGTTGFYNLIAFEWERAHSYFEKAWNGFRPEAIKKLLPAMIMGEIYYKILLKIKERGFNTLKEKVRVPSWEKLYIIGKSLIRCI